MTTRDAALAQITTNDNTLTFLDTCRENAIASGNIDTFVSLSLQILKVWENNFKLRASYVRLYH